MNMAIPRFLHFSKKTTKQEAKIRVERLQDISEQDAISEGIESQQNVMWKLYDGHGWVDKPVMSYITLWESINGKDSWVINPWVWVISFEKL
jgi:hypothetical protein